MIAFSTSVSLKHRQFKEKLAKEKIIKLNTRNANYNFATKKK